MMLLCRECRVYRPPPTWTFILVVVALTLLGLRAFAAVVS